MNHKADLAKCLGLTWKRGLEGQTVKNDAIRALANTN